MPARSAGILLHRSVDGRREVLLVHPGGPLWAGRDEGAWGLPKGEIDAGEEELAAARREFAEELGVPPPDGAVLDLGEVRQRSGKRVRAFALAGEVDVESVRSNTCEIVWPPRSGRKLEIPEIDQARWFGLPEARVKILPAQLPLLERLAALLDAAP